MNVKSIAAQFGEERAYLALSSRFGRSRSDPTAGVAAVLAIAVGGFINLSTSEA